MPIRRRIYKARRPRRSTRGAFVGRKVARKRVMFRKRTVGRKLKAIKVKHDSITTSFNKSYNTKNAFMRKMAAKYWVGARNLNHSVYQRVLQLTPGNQVVGDYAICNFAQIYNALTAVGLAPGAAGSVRNTARVYLSSIRGIMNFTNSSNGNVFVDLYEYIAHRDCGYTPLQLWETSLDDQQSTTVASTLTYGITPLMTGVEISTYWRCKKVIHIELPPGASHEQHFNYHIDCPYNNALFNSNINSDMYFKGLTRYYMVVVRGAAVNAPNATDPNSSTTAGARLNMIVSTDLDWKYLQDQDTTMNISTTGSYVSNGFNVVAGNIYNQGSGGSMAEQAYA